MAIERDINEILDDVRGMLMQIRAMASIKRRQLTDKVTTDQEIAEEFQNIVSLANFALKTLEREFPRGDRPPIDAFLLDDD